MHCNTLQCTATHYNALQHSIVVEVTYMTREMCIKIHSETQCNALQHTATYCNRVSWGKPPIWQVRCVSRYTPQQTATRCNTLQHGMWLKPPTLWMIQKYIRASPADLSSPRSLGSWYLTSTKHLTGTSHFRLLILIRWKSPNQQINKSTNQQINKSTNKSTNQQINQQINKSTKQPYWVMKPVPHNGVRKIRTCSVCSSTQDSNFCFKRYAT